MDRTPRHSERPTIEASWSRIDAWLAEHAPVTHRSLKPPAGEAEIADAERRLGLTFHPDLVASLRCHDGTAEQEGAFQFARLWGTVADLTDIVRNNELLRDIARHAEDAEDAEDEEEEEDAYWRDEWLLITRGVSGDAQDGLFLSNRAGGHHGALGEYFNEDDPSFTEWPSLRTLLADIADTLDGDGRLQGAIPVVFQGRLIWETEPKPLVTPRSVLALAAEAGEPAEPERHYTAEVPAAARYGGNMLVLIRVGADVPAPEQPDALLVEGVAPAELLRLVGVREETVRKRSPRQAREAAASTWAANQPMARAGACGSWSYLLEEGRRPQADRVEVLRRLSAGTRLAVLRRDTLTVYRDGAEVLVRTFGERAAAHGSGGRASRPAGAAHGNGRVPEEVYAEMLAELRSVCGVEFDPDDPALSALPSGLVLPLLPELDEGHVSFSCLHELLGDAVTDVPPTTLRAALSSQLRRLAAETGIADYPEVAEAVSRVAEGERWTVTDGEPLGVRARWLGAEVRASQLFEPSWRVRETPLISNEEATAWRYRASAACAVRVAAQAPVEAAVSHVLRRRRSARWRAEFLSDLGQ